MSIKLIVPKKKNNLRAEDIPVGNICREGRFGAIALRTKTRMLFLHNLNETLIQDCKEIYEDLGPLEIEFSDS